MRLGWGCLGGGSEINWARGGALCSMCIQFSLATTLIVYTHKWEQEPPSNCVNTTPSRPANIVSCTSTYMYAKSHSVAKLLLCFEKIKRKRFNEQTFLYSLERLQRVVFLQFNNKNFKRQGHFFFFNLLNLLLIMSKCLWSYLFKNKTA